MIPYSSKGLFSLLGGLGLSALLGAGICVSALAQKTQAGKHAAHAHAKITSDQAKAIALKKFAGNVEGKILLENEEGSWQYAVNVRSGKVLREVMVDAKTGKIANVEVTSKSEEAKEQKAETDKMKHAPTVDKSHKKP